MISSNVKKYPIVIISTPRSGSTSLGRMYVKKYNIPFHNEPDEIIGNVYEKKFKRDIETTDRFLVKFHARRIQYYNEYIDKIKNGHLIKISRKNIVNQITSTHIALERNKWVYKNKTEYNDIVSDDDEKLISSIKTIMNYNQSLNNLEFSFDEEFFYEDIEFNDSADIVTPKPKNEEELKEKIIFLMNKWKYFD